MANTSGKNSSGQTTLQSLLPALVEQLTKDGYLGMILVDAAPLNVIEKVHGSATFDRILDSIYSSIGALRGTLLRTEDLIAASGHYGEQFLVILSQKRTGGNLKHEDLEMVADRVHIALLSRVIELVTEYSGAVPRIDIGFATAIHNPMLRAERVLYRLIGEARTMAQHQRFRFSVRSKERLRELIINGGIRTVYQPIVRLSDRQILGYEALSRGPEGTAFHSPQMLFLVAEETDLLFELDQHCRQLAMQNAHKLPGERLLFVNTLPASIHDPTFRDEYLAKILEAVDLAPSRIVIEVTESLAIQGYQHFHRDLTRLRQSGIAIAIDDAGTGYANLALIEKLRPDFIKVDLSLIRDIHAAPIKQEMVHALLAISKKMGAALIAEGVETLEERNTLADLGVEYAQGFLFSRPQPDFVEVEFSGPG